MADSFLSDELLTETNHEILRHLDTCASCRAEIAVRRQFRASLQVAFERAPDLQPPPDFVGVSWLPPYHDMGLIGGLLEPVYAGGHHVISSPASFLQQPLRWLRYISDYRAALKADTVCDKCLRDNPANARYCAECGNLLREIEEASK